MRYRYSGELTVVNFAGEWTPGDVRDVDAEINHPHFERVKTKGPDAAPVTDTPADTTAPIVVLVPDPSLNEAISSAPTDSPSSMTEEVTDNG